MTERKRLVVDLTAKEHAKIERAARRAGLTISNLIRKAFRLAPVAQGKRPR